MQTSRISSLWKPAKQNKLEANWCPCPSLFFPLAYFLSLHLCPLPLRVWADDTLASPIRFTCQVKFKFSWAAERRKGIPTLFRSYRYVKIFSLSLAEGRALAFLHALFSALALFNSVIVRVLLSVYVCVARDSLCCVANLLRANHVGLLREKVARKRARVLESEEDVFVGLALLKCF